MLSDLCSCRVTVATNNRSLTVLDAIHDHLDGLCRAPDELRVSLVANLHEGR